ncbi:hypothetical protein [Paenibacillus aestuarii]|uniref:Uncharacterized protein n=1 Tax=Paenibacillus aestuarii TaxID=516965 RepID=A0ABW0KB46_9BACL|nr:hypothetical protein [Paenibacillus aestuarii]
MKKRRSTVLVTPGKDVTLYIPSDTPPQVIHYMNQLKTEGTFSQGIMEILIKHILAEPSLTIPSSEKNLSSVYEPFSDDADFIEEPVGDEDQMGPTDEPVASSQISYSLEDIFRQASRNAGKLFDQRN